MSGEGRCYLTNTHAALSGLPSLVQPFFGWGWEANDKPPKQKLLRNSSHAARPRAPSIPFSGEWYEPINRVTEFTSGYLWSTPVYPTSPWIAWPLYAFSSTCPPAAPFSQLVAPTVLPTGSWKEEKARGKHRQLGDFRDSGWNECGSYWLMWS